MHMQGIPPDILKFDFFVHFFLCRHIYIYTLRCIQYVYIYILNATYCCPFVFTSVNVYNFCYSVYCSRIASFCYPFHIISLNITVDHFGVAFFVYFVYQNRVIISYKRVIINFSIGSCSTVKKR